MSAKVIPMTKLCRVCEESLAVLGEDLCGLCLGIQKTLKRIPQRRTAAVVVFPMDWMDAVVGVLVIIVTIAIWAVFY